jgi:hypothetical protein
VNRLKRGGSLFEGVVLSEAEEYIIGTRCARSGLPSSECIPYLSRLQPTMKSSYGIIRRASKQIGSLDNASDYFTVGAQGRAC